MEFIFKLSVFTLKVSLYFLYTYTFCFLFSVFFFFYLMSFPNASSDQQSTALPPLLVRFYSKPVVIPFLGRPILGASNHGCFSFLSFLVDFWLLV